MAPVSAATSSSSCGDGKKISVDADFLGRKVWIPDAKEGFSLATIIDIGSDNVSAKPLLDGGGGKNLLVPYESVFSAEEDDGKDVEDNCGLMFLNEATLLHNIRVRYDRQRIYTYVANILIALNPYEEIEQLYSSDSIETYQGKSLGAMPPHIFAIADKAYRDMRRFRESQSVVVSGESGAGKTESQKHILRYLCESWGSAAGPIEKRILETNPILEAFGNARTLRNNNSSRFGKFVEIHFDNKHHVAGGFVSHYLLEKSRICRQQAGERNYHVFYQMLAGAEPELRKELMLGKADAFHYLNRGCTRFFCSDKSARSLLPSTISQQQQREGALSDAIVDDIVDWHRLDGALADIGLPSDVNNRHIYSAVAAVLHLGNIVFLDSPDDSRGGCLVDPLSKLSLEKAAQLLGIDVQELRCSLTTRVMQPTKGGVKGTLIRVPLKPFEAASARDALAKAVYSKLFDFIVSAINASIPFGEQRTSQSYIGVLDIAGFEFFAVNEFEQFCINYCNEKLQQFFNDRILKQEQLLYEQEGLGVRKIEFLDNQDCIDLIERKGSGIIDVLDEEHKLPKSSGQHFTEQVHKCHSSHFRLLTPRKSKLKEHRGIRDNDGFIIRHFAGAVCYETRNFLAKNNDALHDSLRIVVEESDSPLIRRLFPIKEQEVYSKPGPKGKLAFESVSSKFRSQLVLLLRKLETTGTHFVRCIKPNGEMLAGRFEGAEILSQLKCSGMASVLELMQQGYPSRTQFSDLYDMYHRVMPADLARLDPRLFCKCLFKALGLNETDFKFGLTKVFFRPGKFAEFDKMLRSDSDNLKELIGKVRSWLCRMRWKKAQWGALSVIKLRKKIEYRCRRHVRIQSAYRGWSARKQHKPRIVWLRRLDEGINGKIADLDGTFSASANENVGEKWRELRVSAERQVAQIRDSVKRKRDLSESEFLAEMVSLEKKFEQNVAKLRVDIAKEERERLAKFQEELEKERRRRKAEEEAKLLAEKEEQQRIRLVEEEKRRKAAEMLEVMVQQEDEKTRQQQLRRERELVQEKADREMAFRVAKEINGNVEEKQPEQPKSNNARLDLTKWKYPELRDAINTSSDIQLLSACKEEFRRRLKAYHEWKVKQEESKMGRKTPEKDSAKPSAAMEEQICGQKRKLTEENGEEQAVKKGKFVEEKLAPTEKERNVQKRKLSEEGQSVKKIKFVEEKCGKRKRKPRNRNRTKALRMTLAKELDKILLNCSSAESQNLADFFDAGKITVNPAEISRAALLKMNSAEGSDERQLFEITSDGKSVKKLPPSDQRTENDNVVFVDCLPAKVKEQDVEVLFSKFGTVARVGIPKDAYSNRGFAFVTFATVASARAACEFLRKTKSAEETAATTSLIPSSIGTTELQTTETNSTGKTAENSAKTAEEGNKAHKKTRRKKAKKKLYHVPKVDAKKLCQTATKLDLDQLKVWPWAEWKRLKDEYKAEQKTNVAAAKKRYKELTQTMEADSRDTAELPKIARKKERRKRGIDKVVKKMLMLDQQLLLSNT